MSQTLKYLLVFILGICSVIAVDRLTKNARKMSIATQYLNQGKIITRKLQSKNISQEGLVFFRGVYLKDVPKMMFALDYNPTYRANKIVMVSLPDGQINFYMDGHGKFNNNQLSDSKLRKEFPDIFSDSPDVFKNHNSSNQKPSTTVTSENQKP